MTRYTILVYYKEYDAFLQQLREKGMLHVIEKQSGAPEEGSDLQRFMQRASHYDKALREMRTILGNEVATAAPEADGEDADLRLEAFEGLLEDKTKKAQQISVLQKEVERITPWGDFSWASISALRDAGQIMRFFTCAQRNFKQEWIDTWNAFIIAEVDSLVYFVTVTPSGVDPEPDDAERVSLPKESLSELLQLRQLAEEQVGTLEQQIHQFCLDWYNTIEAGYRAALEAIDYETVVLNSESEVADKLRLIEGWVPTENEQEVNDLLNAEGVYYESRRADKEDPAPVKLSNNRFARLFHPITELYDLPAYGETDLTPFFAPFFVMFFGLCLGDAGYGLLLALAGFIMRAKAKPSMKPMMTLVGILGIGTVIFGTLSGTLFGISLIDVKWPWIMKLKQFMMSSNDLFYFSLMVGVLQIVFGMVLKAIGQTKRFGFKNALSAWGWLILIVGCGGSFALNKAGVIDESLARILMYITGGIGALGIFVLNDIKRNPLINIGSGVWDTYNMASGLLGDILSYVRLFALGISGSVLGLVFNDLAVKMSPDIPVVGFLVTAIILLFGHGMNIFMSGLGAFVHPMRLTFVEFYKNAGFEGGGKKFHPFARRQKED